MSVPLGKFIIGQDQPFRLIAGPCQIESRDHAFFMAEALHGLCQELDIKLIYKSSFDKANRSSVHAARGVGMEEGLKILSDIRSRFNIPVLTDVHAPEQCAPAAEAVDVLQIPAFLCRQTDLLLAAGRTGRAINVKKGQFLAPQDMQNIVDKLKSTGNERILLCERGTCFGYNTLINDMRALPIMARTGYPVVFDATHSVQQPGGLGTATGGQREFVAPLARAALATGVSALFIETHQEPDTAPSDGPTMIPLAEMRSLLTPLKKIDELVKAEGL
ncbi:3-deoxy-8-phosphooctulonate synthase [Parasaccharibacter sp. TMW2.1882]|uniref:2-dehydro-3-deoxyphosphooctonate aldolase n=2 Tax=Acetobacteraceae TaxID=433 RepID=A0ABX4ZLQ8_9PROT|nr:MULTISPECIES: 3-deoxy-8-phosphooctulonate synthase [Acetobacteraceae]MCQ0041970.1 3-deoxy-8-phosphooctulonate synthase [Bombella sp.]QGT74994.1 3-deoxy-8-phosphooctulonate synthase [Bombella sp. ESL0368]MBE1723131.1 3-deoxy-8-phosphooctulonate synthase [Bombella apis]MBR9730938.1 3-deoxy-8-phosphooctulonate synthase [Bombella apis]MCK8636622.1 3-deoxy-8-phosphooctulonate synthase [Parasaccharibacter sp. TMW2.1885]